ncbi:TreTu family toxin [Polycladospora coralii]
MCAETLVTVGRWMNPKEYESMLKNGKVQQSNAGVGGTYVAHPADSEAYIKQAKLGDYYVEFDVPQSSIKQTSAEWGYSIGPKTLEAKKAKIKGLSIPQFPDAININHTTSKARW